MADQCADFLAAHVLGDEVEGAKLHRLHGGADVGCRRRHDDFRGRVVLAQDAQQLEPRDAWLVDVDDRDVDLVADQQRECAFRARGAHDPILLPQRLVQRLAAGFVSIDDQQILLACRHVGEP